MKTIARGAEAVLSRSERDGQAVVVKDRISKGYRVPELDNAIRSQRTKTESRLLARARRAGLRAPRVLSASGSVIEIEFIEGPTVKEAFNGMDKRARLEVCEQIGKAAARLHAAGIMHGDLTTSNLVLKGGSPDELYVIDFGLARTSARVEDHAVDLYLLYEALKAAHFRFLDEAWRTIIKAYKYNNAKSDIVLGRLAKIERRRRYRGE
jgi:Kae1-associated kinase Bud32